jgi:hypothetical protein
MAEFHREEFLFLPEVTHKTAIIAWGAFYFKIKGKVGDEEFKLVDDGDLDNVHPPRHQTIGRRSEPYGSAVVEVRDGSGALAAREVTATANHVLIRNLLPDTEYTYRVVVNGEGWGEDELRDWDELPGGELGLRKSGRRYDNRFRTHPHPTHSAQLTFAVLGDFGTGVRRPSKPGSRQREVAEALERAVADFGVRLVLTTGDNIYASKKLFGKIAVGGQGDEDDDWYFTFYQPYRYVVNRVPFYPSVGNHDSGESEFENDDRTQLMDNFYLEERLAAEVPANRASIGPGLFYRFLYGSDIEFICLDTSKASLISGHRFFQAPEHAAFLEEAFRAPEEDEDVPAWRIPFGHHPPYTAGPSHANSKSVIKHLLPLFRRAGVQVTLWGHEHNFQLAVNDGIHHIVTGGGGKVADKQPEHFAEAFTVAWATAGHFLLVDVDRNRMKVRPIGELSGAGLADIRLQTPGGDPVSTPITVTRG